MKIVPPKPEPIPPFQPKLALVGIGVGCVVGFVGWFFSGSLVWFLAVPAGVLLGFGGPSKTKPPVVWWHRMR